MNFSVRNNPISIGAFVLFLLVFFTQCCLADRHHYDVVLDIDYTILSPVDELESKGFHVPQDRVIVADGKRFLIVDGVENALSQLIKNPHIRISFFSGGDKARNQEALKLIRLPEPDGRSLYELAYKVLSKDDLTNVQPNRPLDPPRFKFHQKFKKDLLKVSKNLDQVVLIDDVENFALPSQRANTVWLGKTYESYSTYADAKRASQDATTAQYAPKTPGEWLRERKKIFGALEIVAESIEESEKNGSTLLKTIVKKQADLSWNHYVIRGLARFSKNSQSQCVKNALDF